MEAYFATKYDDIRHERTFSLLLSTTDPDILKQNKFTDYEINIIKILALEELHRQKCSKEYFAVQSKE